MMTDVNEALRLMLSYANRTNPEEVALDESFGRVLAKDVIADSDMPLFNRSTMDGYAIHSSDIDKNPEVIGLLPAGSQQIFKLEKGKALRIMTGAPVPEGADMVVPIEDCQVSESRVSFKPIKKSNISLKGEDYKKGDVLLTSGTFIEPQHLAILAAAGCTKPMVYSKVKVGIIVSGNELVESDHTPAGSQIRNTNGPMLVSLCRQNNLLINNYGVISDEPEVTRQVMEKAISENDTVLVSGGISGGDFDLVPGAIEQLKGQIVFRKVNIQPGKPFLFAIVNNKPLIGLPGNPVASLVTFHVLANPFLQAIMGRRPQPRELNLPLHSEFNRPGGQRLTYIPVYVTPNGQVEIIHYNGSGHLHSYAYANAMAILEQGQNQFSKGDLIRVRLL
jgi:molybdopterin molybdotransferase